MFGIVDHITGAAVVRVKRIIYSILKKPDASFIHQNIAIGGHCSIASLVKNNFECILDVRQELQDNKNDINRFFINYLNIPVIDRQNPNHSQVKNALFWINQNVSKNKKIFIHCNLGRGRAPTIACIYLISKGMTPNDAISLVKKKRRYTYFNKKQLDLIQKFKLT